MQDATNAFHLRELHWCALFSFIVQDEQQYVSKVKQRLIKINNDITKAITMSPLQQRGENELPIELLYAQVVVCEDPKFREKGHGFTQHNREVVNPDDILMQNNEVVKKIYMLGDAAHGKTTYCIWLVKNWCSAQHGDPEGIKQLDHWGKALRKFDFVFLLQLRNVNRKRASMIDMICMDVFGDDRVCHLAIRHILSSEKYRSLVIMDGLDEWDPDEETRKQLTRQGMPNTEGISSTVSCFFSMRPWVFSTISKLGKSQ
ncbi:hypothetical protein FSP39_017212 [Pinctada imbricata]|uniref:NACHT domain-containing protein n=1 Tax=Pinctada imbricata TaxID=66713 RepID=A0AA89BW17_PINIB|nr:hypothetical protein FSP39_017212 [Pinctada imbricata]